MSELSRPEIKIIRCLVAERAGLDNNALIMNLDPRHPSSSKTQCVCVQHECPIRNRLGTLKDAFVPAPVILESEDMIGDTNHVISCKGASTR